MRLMLRKSSLIAAGAGALFCLLVVTPQRAHATFAGRPGLIVFNLISFHDGSAYTGGLYAIRPGQEHPRQLTTNPWDYGPSFAPSGKELVFRRTNTPQPGIYTLDMRTGATTRVASVEGDLDPAFGPNGMIAFSRFVDGSGYDLFLRTRKGRLRLLTSDSGRDQEPIFTPDGKRIVFSRDYRKFAPLLFARTAPEREGLYSIRLDGSGLRFLGDLDQGGSDFDISPDGRRLLFSVLGDVTMDSVESDARTRPLEGGESRLVSDNAQFPSYSPAGNKIAYSNYEGLWTRRADGRGSPTHLLETDYRPYQEGGSFLIEPVWQPLP
jgi:Tol biopolymer transport system component